MCVDRFNIASLFLSNPCTPSTLSKEAFVYFVCPTEIPQPPFAWKYYCLEGSVSHRFRRQLAPCGAAKAARLFNSTCARAVFAAVGRVRCSQRVGAGTLVDESMNTLRPTGLATKNEAPVGTVLGGLGGVSNAIAI